MAQRSRRMVHTVVMVRHGESLWNVEKRFTGWCDVPLTTHGEADAKDAGNLMGERGMKFDIAFTSNLERAWRTCSLVLSSAGQSDIDVVRSFRLNERHYGALQGHEKSSPALTAAFSEETLIEWRRSYKSAPPSPLDEDFLSKIGRDEYNRVLQATNPRYLDHSMRKMINNEQKAPSFSSYLYPWTESLKACEIRAYGYWKSVIAPQVKEGKRVLIVAHANTIRALVKAMDNISDDKIAHLKIPNGIPLVYTLDSNLHPIETQVSDEIGFQASYLVSARNHGKMMAYEKCVYKKLRSLFEYLDTDGDGRITPLCLQQGINKLQSGQLFNNNNNTTTTTTTTNHDIDSMTTDSTIPPPHHHHHHKDLGSGTVYEDTQHTGVLRPRKPVLKKNVVPIAPVICEYEVEELLRCIPNADEHGGVTLEAFLQSEETLLPQLTRLRLLQ